MATRAVLKREDVVIMASERPTPRLIEKIKNRGKAVVLTAEENYRSVVKRELLKRPGK